MNARPLSITVVGWLFVCVGCAGLAGGVYKFIGPSGPANASGSDGHELVDLALVTVSGIMAGVGGAFVLRGEN